MARDLESELAQARLKGVTAVNRIWTDEEMRARHTVRIIARHAAIEN
jgi:hypothetical protein